LLIYFIPFDSIFNKSLRIFIKNFIKIGYTYNNSKNGKKIIMMVFGGLIFTLFIGGLIVAALGLANVFSKDSTSVSDIFGSRKVRSPREILAERYARGDLSREEFETMRSDIDKIS